tara:strand:+ start:381 stop:2417 length:2037 start_codon:yes stop_codon:yes gene_type:complete
MKQIFTCLFLFSTFPFTAAQTNHSLSFDGEDDYIRILDNEILQFESDFSVSLWYKLSVSPQVFQIMVSKQGTGAPNGYGWMYGFSNGANWYVNVENQGGQVQIAGGSYPNIGNLNQWHNVVFVFDQNNTVTLYLDGELLYSINVGDISPSSDVIADLLFGVDREEQKFLNAKMDEISIWNQVLTQEQIEANISSELSGSEEGLVGYWNFNEGEGATLTDLSGNGNDGTINGATWSDDGAPVQPAFFASLSVATVDAIANSAVLVPIEVDLMGESISSVEIHFGGYQGHVDFVAVDTTATLVGDAEWNIEINEQEDLLITGTYGSSEISANGTLMRLKFEVSNNIDTNFVPVVIIHAEMDEIEGVIDVVNGGIEIDSLLYGDVSQNNNVSLYDASLVLKYLIGTETLDETQLVAAEVTQDGTVSALDATAIAQYAIEIIDALPVVDTQNLTGGGTIFINETMFQPGELLEVPVMLTNGNNLLSFEIDLSYESDAITLESITWSDLIGHFTIEENYEGGSIKVAGLGTEPDGEEGVFATVSLFIASSFTDESFDVTINKYRINESDPIEDVVVTFTNSALGIDENTIPTVYALHQNYPNPFNPSTQVNYDLPERGSVQIMIYDLMGRKVKTLINNEQNAGFKNIQWNATNNRNEPVSAGLYLYTIQAGEFRQTKKMVLLK